ncbi:HIT family protein [Pleionea litopenaei]|uniref:HIT family protein n=1 Tax=Pleionea litopenaei TaxID=3070815 RepID=A0AA51RXA3_9GAMM|nr:HIT family protein [Pleionea sp. HL-JVS1]WMS89159.1 HIT family protein [Pleionea sp. HL-JVS1]
MFSLDQRLKNDCVLLTDLALSQLLLMNDQQYPWLILVPRVADIQEVFELSNQQQGELWKEVAMVSKLLNEEFKPEKINIGALGNIVRQLHVHVVARNKQDVAWPGPVWGAAPAKPYSEDELVEIRSRVLRNISSV